MKKVFISGSINIKKLDDLVIASLDKIISNNLQILVGDAYGVDKLVQEYFFSKGYFNIIVYTIFDKPRNLLSNHFKIKRIEIGNLQGRKAQEKKDEAMTIDSDYSFVIWNGKSRGSFNNILRALKNDKKLKVYYEKERRFLKEDELNIDNIERIYYKHNGFGLKELAKYSNQSLSYIKDFVKHYPQFRIVNNNKGRERIRYSIELLDILVKNNLFEISNKRG